MVTKVCYVGEGFTRKPPKYERFIRPMVSRLRRHIYCIMACTVAFLKHYYCYCYIAAFVEDKSLHYVSVID